MKRWTILLPAFVAILAIVVLQRRMGFSDYTTRVVQSEQANDSYLENLLRSKGYDGKRVDDPNRNLFSSTWLTKFLERNGYA